MRFRILLLCLIFSGFTGLAYQLLWVRILALTFGSTTASFATVLAVFFGGLALGSWLAARYLGKFDRPGLAYGIIEGIMGVVGIGLYPVLVHLGSAFSAIDPGPGILGGLLRAFIAAPLLLIPTILMGMTLPLLCKAMITDNDQIGKGTGLIYGFNTLGACFGAFLTTYVLIPEVGVFKAILITAVCNWIIMGITCYVVRDEHKLSFTNSTETKQKTSDVNKAPSNDVLIAFLITFLSGFAFIAVEIVWSRLFSTILGGTIYGVGSVLIAILLGIATGSWIAALTTRMGLKPYAALTISLSIFALGVLGILKGIEPLAYFIKFIAETAPHAHVRIYYELAAMLLILFIPSAAIGSSLPLLVQAVEDNAARAGRTLGNLYSVNTAGSIIGSLLTGFFFLPSLGSETTSYLVLLTLVAAIAMAAATAFSQGSRWILMPAALACLSALMFEGYARDSVSIYSQGSKGLSYQQLHQITTDQKKKTIYFSEGKNATVKIVKDNYTLGMSLNGLGQGARSLLKPEFNLESTLVAYVGLPFVKDPKRAFVVGLGAGNTVHALKDLGIPHTKVVELEPKVVDAVDEMFKDYGGFGPNVEIEINDARHSLATHAAKGGESYDLIASMPAHPWVANPIFTKEFFEIAKKNLSKHGVFVSWFGSSHGTIQMDQAVTDSVSNAFVSVFENFAIFYVPETMSIFLVGSPSPLTFDLDTVEKLMQHPRIAAHEALQNPFFLPVRSNAWRNGDTPIASLSPINTDDSAYAEVWAPRTDKTNFTGTNPDLIQAKTWPDASMVSDLKRFYDAAYTHYFDLTKFELLSPASETWDKMAAKLLDASKETVTPGEHCAGSVKRELIMTRIAEANRLLQSCPQNPDIDSLRAFVKLQETYSPENVAGVPYSKELALAIMDLIPNTLPQLGNINSNNDVVAWIYDLARTGRLLTTDEKNMFEEKYAAEIIKTARFGLIRYAASVASKNDMTHLSQLFTNGTFSVSQARAAALYKSAMDHWNANNRIQSVRLLEEVVRLSPQHRLGSLYLIKGYQESGKQDAVNRIKNILASTGINKDSIDAMLALDVQHGASESVPAPIN